MTVSLQSVASPIPSIINLEEEKIIPDTSCHYKEVFIFIFGFSHF